MLEYFKATSASLQGNAYLIYLEELNIHPEQFKGIKLISKEAKANWTPSQTHRAEILFNRYPDVQKAYKLLRSLARINQTSKIKGIAFTKLAHWYNEVKEAGFKSFNTVSRNIQNHCETILNFFENRSTNASAESFNAKIKAFRAQFRGVTNVKFFLFRLSNTYG